MWGVRIMKRRVRIIITSFFQGPISFREYICSIAIVIPYLLLALPAIANFPFILMPFFYTPNPSPFLSHFSLPLSQHPQYICSIAIVIPDLLLALPAIANSPFYPYAFFLHPKSFSLPFSLLPSSFTTPPILPPFLFPLLLFSSLWLDPSNHRFMFFILLFIFKILNEIMILSLSEF